MTETNLPGDLQPLPFVSVLMPVRNEGKFIERSLGAVLAQDYPSERMEIIVADGMSHDMTRRILDRLASGRDNILRIDNPGKIVATGLNRAIEISRGEIIVRVDGHCEIAGDYVSKCVGHLLQSKVAGVGGPMETIGETPTAQTIALAMSSPFGVGGSAFRTIKDRDMFVETVPFPAYWRKDILAAGPFDEELVRNQDDEYNYRLISTGRKLLLAADVHSRYYSRSSLRSLWRQYFQYGFYKVRVMQKHPRQMRLRQFMPALLIAGLVGSALLALIFPAVWPLPLAVLGSYIAANLSISFLTAAKFGWRHLGLLPVIYSILHFSYGLGFWTGMVRYVGYWNKTRPKFQTAGPSSRPPAEEFGKPK